MDFLEDFELHTLTFVDKSWPSTSHIGNILDLGGKGSFIILNNPLMCTFMPSLTPLNCYTYKLQNLPSGKLFSGHLENLSMCPWI